MRLNCGGQALVEILVAVGIMGVCGMAALSMIDMQVRETKAVGDRLGALDVERSLLAALADGGICQFVFKGKTFDETQAKPLYVDSLPVSPFANAPVLIKVGLPASPLTSSLMVKTIALDHFKSSGQPNSYLADLTVIFDSTKLVRAIRPIQISTGLQTDPSVKGAVKTILNCSSTGAGLCTPGPKLYIGTEVGCNAGHLATDPSFFACKSAYLGTLCKTQ